MRTDSFDDMDSLFDRMNRFAGFDDSSRRGGNSGMRVDLSEHDDELVAVVDLPGFDRDEIDLSVAGERLQISASHDEQDSDETERYIRRERHANTARRTISLPVAVDADEASATYTNGVLTITLPKQAEDEGHRIDIN